MADPLVSVVITCFNHAHFLKDAIESVLVQSFQDFEIVVVDDGSTDETRHVAAHLPVRYLYQENRGLAAARNSGTRISSGEYVVYLDADDLLAPRALEVGVKHLDSRIDCAFVSGDHRRVDATLRPLFKDAARSIFEDHYIAMLRGNYIAMNATVMYRKRVVEAVGGFREEVRACEDYAIYLTITRTYPVLCHSEVVAYYRQHNGNMSQNSEFMLGWALAVLEVERHYITGDAEKEAAYREGKRFWRDCYRKDRNRTSAVYWVRRAYRFFCRRRYRLRDLPRVLLTRFRRSHALAESDPVRMGSFESLQPICADASPEETVEQWYTREFLVKCNSAFTEGPNMVGFVGDPAALESDSQNCLFCLMRLQYVADPAMTIGLLARALKPGGVLMLLVPGTVATSDSANPHDLWRFTDRSIRRLAAPHFGRDAIQTFTFGNALTALASLHRIPAVALREEELRIADPQQQLMIGLRAVKE